MKSFDIYFSGQILGNQDLAVVKTNIGKLFKLSGSRLEGLFSGKPVRIKSAIDVEEAGKYREAFRRAGGIIEVVPHGQRPLPPSGEGPTEEKKPASATRAAPEFELMPAHSGSLIDVARPVPTPVEPDLMNYSLAPAGALIPQAEPVESPKIDTSHIHAEPANTGSLEEFAERKDPAPIPDISHIHAAAPGEGNTEDLVPPSPAPEPPDTSHIHAAPANSGSLEDCVEEKPPVQIPDISNITLADQ